MPEVNTVEECAAALVDLARQETGMYVTRVTVDYQDSGQYPYRIETPEEQYPVAGLAMGEGLPAD
jgi:hypothetical protein